MSESRELDPEEYEEAIQILSLEESYKAGVAHPGLPRPLPENEHIFWHGSPSWPGPP